MSVYIVNYFFGLCDQKILFSTVYSVYMEQIYPLSYEQEQMAVLSQSSSRAYCVHVIVKIVGDLNPTLLKRAIDLVVLRNETFRTLYDRKTLTQRVTNQTIQTIITRDPVLTESLAFEQVQKFCDDSSYDVFGNQLPTRVMIVPIDDQTHLLGMLTHHICVDGTSFPNYMTQIVQFYMCLLMDENYDFGDFHDFESILQYGQYALNQRQLPYDDHVSFWEHRLEGCQGELPLPNDYPYRELSTRGGAIPVSLDSATVNRLFEVCELFGRSMFKLLFSLFQIMMMKITHSDDVIIGTPYHGRTTPELKKAVGYFVKMLPLRMNRLAGETLSSYVERMDHIFNECTTHLNLPLYEIIKCAHIDHNPHRLPLFQTCFDIGRQLPPLTIGRHMTITQITRSSGRSDGISQFELSLNLNQIQKDQPVTGLFEYNTDLFIPQTVEHLARSFEYLCQQVNKSVLVSDLVMCPQPVRSMELPIDDRCLHQLFLHTAQRTPSATAITYAEHSISYSQVNQLSDEIANVVSGTSPTPGQIVGVYTTRTDLYISAILGILKAGCAFLPLSIDLPRDRLISIIRAASCECVLVDEVHPDLVKEYPKTQWININTNLTHVPHHSSLPSTPHKLAYVIATSGTTGLPKLVGISHQAIVMFLRAWIQKLGVETLSRSLLSCSTSVDTSIQIIFGALCSGGCVVLPHGSLTDLPMVSRLLPHVTYAFFVPSYLVHLCEHTIIPKSLSCLDLGGEEVRYDLLSKLADRLHCPRLINGYGPTETTVVATVYEIQDKLPAGPVPIGQPLSTHTCYVMDQDQHVVPPSYLGELYIGGSCVSSGYLGQSSCSEPSTVFVTLSSGQRVYKTGDLVRQRSDGNIIFLGRLDHQVKVRGNRIELGEIESQVRQVPGVIDAVCLVNHDHDDITCYLTTSSIQSLETSIMTTLRQKLPTYMIPSHVIEMTEFPRIHGGKVDRRALIKLNHTPRPSNLTPLRPEMSQLGSLWSTILRIPLETLGLESNFYEVGGHSLLAISLSTHITETYKVNYSTLDILQAPKFSDMYDRIQHKSRVSDRKMIICIPGAIPASFTVLQQSVSDMDVTVLTYPTEYQSVDDLTQYFISQIKRCDILVGTCAGTMMANEVALGLQRLGRPPSKLVLLNPAFITPPEPIETSFITFLVGCAHQRVSASYLLPRLEDRFGSITHLTTMNEISSRWIPQIQLIPQDQWMDVLLELIQEPVTMRDIYHEMFGRYRKLVEACTNHGTQQGFSQTLLIAPYTDDFPGSLLKLSPAHRLKWAELFPQCRIVDLESDPRMVHDDPRAIQMIIEQRITDDTDPLGS